MINTVTKKECLPMKTIEQELNDFIVTYPRL